MDIKHIALNGRTIPLAIRRHRRARRISLRLSPARDSIVMTLPQRASVDSGMAFFHKKAQWVLANVETEQAVKLQDGAIIPVLGENCVIRRLEGRGVTEIIREANELRIHCKPEFTARRVRDFLYKRLREACLTRARELAAQIGKSVREVKIRHTSSRWGSCSRDGALTIHWQMAFAPPAVLDYLLAHEVAHLAHMNHSERFWKVVAQLCPAYITARRWLKREGHSLHRYGA